MNKKFNSMEDVFKELRRKIAAGEIKPSFDYSELIQEFQEELEDGMLTPSHTVQVLRAEKPIWKEYHPIIDWYYGDESTSILDPKNESPLKRAEQHKQDLPKLEEMLVEDILEEMEEWNKIL